MQAMKPEAIRQLVEIFVAARERRRPVPAPLPPDCRPPSLEEAYRVQAALNERLGRVARRRLRPQDRLHDAGDAALSPDRAPLRRRPPREPSVSEPGHRRARRALAAGGRVRDRGAARATPSGGGSAVRPRGRGGRGRELHGGDRDRRRSLRRFSRPRCGEPRRRRLLQRRRGARRPGVRPRLHPVRPRPRGSPGNHDHQRRRGRLRNRRRRDGTSRSRRSPGSPTTPPRPADHLPRATWYSREASSRHAGWEPGDNVRVEIESLGEGLRLIRPLIPGVSTEGAGTGTIHPLRRSPPESGAVPGPSRLAAP